MHLFNALGIQTAAEIDITRPLKLGAFELGADAATEAVQILNNGKARYDVNLRQREFSEPTYWSIEHRTAGQVELFGFPSAPDVRLPTAIEIALVRAVAATVPEQHGYILSGGYEIAIGPLAACSKFRSVIGVRPPLTGRSLLFADSSHASLHENVDLHLGAVVEKCFVNSFNTSPLKFRFLELYRVMEARFLADVRHKLVVKFDAEPGVALSEAQDALKSEMNQIIGLAETQKDAFEACWTALNQLNSSNRFVIALNRRLSQRNLTRRTQWESGAALIYQIRCAIVHSGAKDLIFESFSDGDDAIEAVISHVERAALLLVGIDLL